MISRMSSRFVWGACLVVLVASATACAGPGPLVVTGATIIDGTGQPPLSGARLVVIDGLISCVGDATACAAPAGADVLDAQGFWVIPGLVDTNIGREVTPIDEQRGVLRFLLGVTTAGVPEPAGGLNFGQEWVMPGPPASPRSVPLLAPIEITSLEGVLDLANDAGLVRGDVADRAARTAGQTMWLAIDPGTLDSLAVALAGRVVIEPQLLARELWAGPYRLPHGLYQLLQLPLVTLAIQDETLPDRTEAEKRELDASLELVRRFLRTFHANGGSLVTGSGGVLAPGLSLHEEMRALVDVGLSPDEALLAATREAAVALGVGDTRGTLEVGKMGDFLIVEADPRLDIANVQTVSRVVKGGVMYDPPTLFDALLDQPGVRITKSRTRVYIGLFAVLFTVFITWRATVQHRRKHGRNWHGSPS